MTGKSPLGGLPTGSGQDGREEELGKIGGYEREKRALIEDPEVLLGLDPVRRRTRPRCIVTVGQFRGASWQMEKNV